MTATLLTLRILSFPIWLPFLAVWLLRQARR